MLTNLSFYFIMILEVANMNKVEMRKVLANNLVALLDYKKISRKNIADDLKLSYTKVCDWTGRYRRRCAG